MTKIPEWLRPFLPYIVLGLVIWAGVSYYNSVQRERGAWAEREKMFHARLDSLERGIKEAQAQFKVDTVRLTKLKSHWDTVKAGVDTLRDTVRVPVEVVREIVHQADTTIKACTMAVTSCSAGWALERAKSATLTAEVAGWRRQANPPLLVRAGRMGKDYLILRAVEAVLVTVLRPK